MHSGRYTNRPIRWQLGVKPTKSLASALVDGAYESDELPFALEEDAANTQQEPATVRQLLDPK